MRIVNRGKKIDSADWNRKDIHFFRVFLYGKNLPKSLNNIPEYVESEKYESWERFFTELLVSLTANGVEEYSKTKLNSFYLQDGIVEKIIEQLPEEILR